MTLPVVVHKFGGAALADASAIANVGALLLTEGTKQRCVVVTSALQSVTDQLLAAIVHASSNNVEAAEGVVHQLRVRHLEVADGLNPPRIAELRTSIDAACDALVSQLRLIAAADAPVALTDAVLAFGERTAANIVREMLDAQTIAAVVVDGTLLIQTDGRHGNAAPDLARTDAAAMSTLHGLFALGKTVIVPGFIGAGNDGTVVTLGRGGSDLSAAVLARALDAREVILWKDVPGLMTADPRIVPGARVVPVLDAREASELAYYGAKVLHPRTLLPLRQGTTLRLRPFADPSASGTTIIVGRVSRGAPVRAISGVSAQALVAVSGTGMLGVPGVAARVFGALAAAHISVSMISQASSEQSICFSVPADRSDEVGELLRTAFAEELARREVEDVIVQSGLATIAVVGSGMAHTPGIAARIFGAIADASVNVIAIAQGSSERNISFVVSESEAPEAVRAVHAAFRLDKVGGGKAGRRAEPTDVILLGMGRVAQEIVTQLGLLTRHKGPSIRVVGMIDTSGYVFHPRGMTPKQFAAVLQRKQSGGTLKDAPSGKAATAHEAVTLMAQHALNRPILIDVASGDTGRALAVAVAHGVDLVLANKAPLAAALADARTILQDARASGRRVLHEATVGAGLPVIDTLQQLHASGDRVDSVDSSPSGTMGFLFSEMGRGRSFSEAVLDAMSRGYTEPDPRDDLSGLDVARKGIILARILGYTGEMADVSLESLVPESLQGVSRAEFLAALPTCDALWEQRVSDARARGEVLRYTARATRGGVRVGLVSVPAGSALASLDGTDNLFVFTTARYRDRPLVVSGPGAGVEVTAAGVLGDVLRLVVR
ncbi:MAG: aspartokinase/homoserine dehydrogenase [Gemmatimonadetes bacterium]|nr:aspartokinase/homoserine dehydrogenase [Gemmatimonadota bacterium]